MVDTEHNTNDYKSSKTSIRTTMKNSEKLRLIPNHLKTKKVHKNGVKNMPYVIR